MPRVLSVLSKKQTLRGDEKGACMLGARLGAEKVGSKCQRLSQPCM